MIMYKLKVYKQISAWLKLKGDTDGFWADCEVLLLLMFFVHLYRFSRDMWILCWLLDGSTLVIE